MQLEYQAKQELPMNIFVEKYEQTVKSGGLSQKVEDRLKLLKE